MSWMEKLHQTYESCAASAQFSQHPLLPIGHTTQQAHVEVVIDEDGAFRRARVLERSEQTTVIPCTEGSGGRAGSKPKNHPLCDKLQYVAGDFREFGGIVTSGFSGDSAEPFKSYRDDLAAWAASGCSHPKLHAILRYIDKKQVVADLVKDGVLCINSGGHLCKEWSGDNKEAPQIFRSMPANASPEDAFIRWRVESPGVMRSGTWEDEDLVDAWMRYYASQQSKKGLCMVTGTEEAELALQHPAKLRHAGDKAKLISSNDTTGYTFRGRFLDADETCGVSFVVTQQAHNALRWLLDSQRNQAFRNGDQIIVAWVVSGKALPDPFANSATLFGLETSQVDEGVLHVTDAGQAFAIRLKRRISGYQADLGNAADVVVMALDSATPGRMAITYYRELTGSEFLERVEAWHADHAWYQDYGRELKFVGAPSPRDIAEAVYGSQVEGQSGAKLRKATVERLLPCIIDGRTVPRDLVESIVRRTSRSAGETGRRRWEWEKLLGICCALYKGHHKRKGVDYQMTLEADRNTRDYLFGRLLAVADSLEGAALYVAGEERPTHAMKMMQRFAERPVSTWRTIELALAPSRARLRTQRPAWLNKLERCMDAIMCGLSAAEFSRDSRLSGEFLLAFHAQRSELRPKGVSEKNSNADSQVNEGE
jgi:CRISPR-associated protein Csd1